MNIRNRFSRRQVMYGAAASLGIIVVAIAGYGAYQKFYYQTPNKIWHDALSSSLQTRSVTVTIAQKSDSTDRKQTIIYNAGSQNQAHSDVVLRSGDSLVVTETIGTKDADYSRYRQIQAANKDYKDVLNVWTKTDHPAGGGSQQDAPLLSGIALRTVSAPGVPLVQTPLNRQIELNKLLNAAVTADFGTVRQATVNGRPAMVFTATIKPEAYITYVKALDEALGYQALTNVTATNFKDRDTAQVQLSVDRASHKLVKLQVSQNDQYAETYSDYNKAFSVTVPANTISQEELQKRLDAN